MSARPAAEVRNDLRVEQASRHGFDSTLSQCAEDASIPRVEPPRVQQEREREWREAQDMIDELRRQVAQLKVGRRSGPWPSVTVRVPAASETFCLRNRAEARLTVGRFRGFKLPRMKPASGI